MTIESILSGKNNIGETRRERQGSTHHESTVTWNGGCEIFDPECSFESTGEESTEWANARGKQREQQGMQLKGIQLQRSFEEGERFRHGVGGLLKQGYGITRRGQAHQFFIVFQWTDEELVTRQHSCEDKAEDDRRDTTTDESLPGFLRGEFRQLGSTVEEAKNVRHDVIADDQRDRKEEPNHPYKDLSVSLSLWRGTRSVNYLRRYSESFDGWK